MFIWQPLYNTSRQPMPSVRQCLLLVLTSPHQSIPTSTSCFIKEAHKMRGNICCPPKYTEVSLFCYSLVYELYNADCFEL